MKHLIVTLGLLMFTEMAHSQVSCSYSVDRELCKEASISLRPELVGQVEIISPEEYKARLAAFDKQEEETPIVYGNGQSVLDREHFNVYHKHVLYQTIYDT